MKIWLENETETIFSFDLQETAKRVLYAVLEEENIKQDVEISVLLTDEQTIKEINSQFREIEKATDVLSFPAIDYAIPGQLPSVLTDDMFSPETKDFILGDIVISVSHLISQAEAYGHSQLREYAFLLTHSLLHLLGYDHMEDKDRKIMENKQRIILEKLEILRS